MTHIDEHELVSGCRAGHRACQHELYRRYSRAMFGTCLRMCANREDAEDLLQNSFVDVYRKLELFRGESTVGAWIKRIVINNCINHLKQRRLQFAELHEDSVASYGPQEDDGYEPPDPGYRVEHVRTAVANLPDGYRAVLTLYLFEGFDHAEIAEVLHISEQTSKSQYSRGRRRLRELLTETARP